MKIDEVILERRGGRKKTGKGKVRNTSTGTPSVQSPAEKQVDAQQAQQVAPSDSNEPTLDNTPMSQDEPDNRVEPELDTTQQAEPEQDPQPQQDQPQQRRPGFFKQFNKQLNNKLRNVVQGFKNTPQQKQGAELSKRFSKRWLDQWNQNVGADPSSNTPEELHDFVSRAFADRINPKLIPMPEKMDPSYVAKYIQYLSGKYISSPSATQQATLPPDFQKAKNKAAADAIYQAELEKLQAGRKAYQDDAANIAKSAAANGGTPGLPRIPGLKPRDIAGAMASKGALSDLSPEPKQSQQLMPGVTIVNNDPIVIDLNNNRYGLNDSGQWTHLKSGKIPPEAIQALLSKQHDISLGI